MESFIKKGETKDELAGGIFVLRDKATKVSSDPYTIDTCGTGGDGQNSLNISTAAAIVLASMGIKVAKHGNKAVSSNCGSADVLEALKVNINLKPNEAEDSIKKFNFAFMFAPNYHSTMKHVGPARKKMGKKTIFNLIGPLSSPAQVKRQVIGVFDKKWMKPFAEALKENNVVHAYIVHSDDGMDEISPFAKTNIVELKDGKTNPPPLLKEHDLMRMMESAGIGTDATIAQHIETIKTREYVTEQQDQTLKPTAVGIGLVRAYQTLEMDFDKPSLRAQMEADCKQIEAGRKNKDNVILACMTAMRGRFSSLKNKTLEWQAKFDEFQNQWNGQAIWILISSAFGWGMVLVGIVCKAYSIRRKRNQPVVRYKQPTLLPMKSLKPSRFEIDDKKETKSNKSNK